MALVDHDAHQPATEGFLIALEAVHGLPGAQQGILAGVLGAFGIIQPAAGDVEAQALATLHQLVEGLGVAAAGQGDAAVWMDWAHAGIGGWERLLRTAECRRRWCECIIRNPEVSIPLEPQVQPPTCRRGRGWGFMVANLS